MIGTAALLEGGTELSFANGPRGLIPYADIPEMKARGGISQLELPNPYGMILQAAVGGESTE